MASKASSIQPREAARRVRRWSTVMLEKVVAVAADIRGIVNCWGAVGNGKLGFADTRASYMHPAMLALEFVAELPWVLLEEPAYQARELRPSRRIQRSLRMRRQVEISPRLLHIPCNLLAQSLHGWELDFLAHPLQEENLHLGIRVQLDRVEVQQVALDGEGVGSKGWAVPDVGDGVEAFFADSRAADVDTVLGNEFFVAAQVDGGNRVLAAVTAPASGCGENRERAPQQVAGAADTAGG